VLFVSQSHCALRSYVHGQTAPIQMASNSSRSLILLCVRWYPTLPISYRDIIQSFSNAAKGWLSSYCLNASSCKARAISFSSSSFLVIFGYFHWSHQLHY
jgi:hypothetical protein